MRKRLLAIITLVLAVSLSLGGTLQVAAAGGDSFQMETEEMMDVTMSVEVVDPEKEAVIVRVNSLLFAQYEEITLALSLADNKENALYFVATEGNAVTYVEGIDFDRIYSVFIHMKGEGRNDYCYGTLEFRYKGDTMKAYHRLSHEVEGDEAGQSSPHAVNYEEESNDTLALADRVYNDDTTYGRISTSSDVDYYKIKFDSSGNANFWLGDIPAGKDFDFYLYNAAGTLIEKSTTTNNQEQIYEVPVLSGVWYYMKVIGYNGAYSSEYYRVRAKLYPSNVSLDSYEPNNSIAAAEWISGNGTISANISSLSDEDYYAISLPSETTLTILLEDIPEGCDYDLELINSSGVRMYQSTNSNQITERISQYLPAGTYYVRVYSYSGYSALNYWLSSSYTVLAEPYQFTVHNYVDQGYTTRFSGGTSAVAGHMAVVSDLFDTLFNLEITSTVYLYNSYIDACKTASYNNITVSNLSAACAHSPANHDDRGNIVEQFVANKGIGTNTMTNVLWTGHILEDNASSASYRPSSFEYYAVVITPKETTNADFSNKTGALVNRESRFDLMHELSHQLGCPDHYCYDPDGANCNNPNCYRCTRGIPKEQWPQCIMTKRIDVENPSNGNRYCDECDVQLMQHLSNHH